VAVPNDIDLSNLPDQETQPDLAGLPDNSQRARIMAYGPVVGERYHDAMYGPRDNYLQPFDVAVSKDMGLELGDWIEVNGKPRRVADWSYFSPGNPTSQTIELRDEKDQGYGTWRKLSTEEAQERMGEAFPTRKLLSGPISMGNMDFTGLPDTEHQIDFEGLPDQAPQQPSRMPTEKEAQTAPHAAAVHPWYERVYSEIQKGNYNNALKQFDSAAQQGVRRALNLPLTGQLSKSDLEEAMQPTGAPLIGGKLSREEREPDTVGGTLIKGTYNALVDTVNFMNTPEGAAVTLLSGGASPGIQRLLAMGFSAQQIGGALDAARNGRWSDALENLLLGGLGTAGVHQLAKDEFGVERPVPRVVTEPFTEAKSKDAEQAQPQAKESNQTTGKTPVVERKPDVSETENQVQELQQQQAAPTPITAELPSAAMGAARAGEIPATSAIGQLQQDVAELHDTVDPAKAEDLTEKLVNEWSRRKSATQQALGRMAAFGQRLKTIWRGVNDPSEVESRQGTLDFELQQSLVRSAEAKRAMPSDFPNQTLREAANLWIDSGGEAGVPLIKEALANLPKGIPRSVRKAMQLATDLPAPGRYLAEYIQDFFKTRGDEGVQAGVMDELLSDYTTHVWKKEANMPDEVHAALSGGRINTYFQFGRQRKIPMFLQGIMAGKIPVLDPSETIPFYNHALDRAISSRSFIKDLSDLTEKDGRPTVSPSGVRMTVGTPEKGAVLISPRAKGSKRAKGTPEPMDEQIEREAQTRYDYKGIDHPAMRKWRWGATDENGRPVFYQADLLVHPDAYKRLYRMMDSKALTPSNAARALLGLGYQVKGAKLGFFSLFHPVHVGSHALFHWTNPFKALGKGLIDPDTPKFRFATEKGHLKVAPSPAELEIFADGVLNRGLLIHKIPLIGRWSKAMSEWTFTQFIPKLKLATFDNAYKRAIWMRDHRTPLAPRGAYKGLTEDQIASRIGDSVNNAFGELNHQFLGKYGRSPQFQRLLRGIFLAPDFGEARSRFAGKALTRYGHEERLALATMFTTLYGGARVANMLSTGDPQWDWRHAFEVKIGDHWWSMRSVIGDLNHMMSESGQFFYHRMNPLYARTMIDWLTSRDVYTGRKLTPSEKFFSRPLEQLVPIQIGGLTRDDQKVWESFVTTMGVQTRRDNPVADTLRLVANWKEHSNDPALRAQWEKAQQYSMPKSDYAKLRSQLDFDDIEGAYREYYRLVTEQGKKDKDIEKALNPKHPFTGSKAAETRFIESLDAEDRATYDRAVAHKEELFDKFQAMLKEYSGQ